MPLTDKGYTAPVAAELTAQIRADFEQLSGLRPVWERDTVLGPLTVVMGDRLGELYQDVQAIYDSRDPNNATGVQLRSLGVATGIPAHDATYSQAVATFTGDPGTVIPAGTLVGGGGDHDRARWATVEDAEIEAGGSVDIVVRCTEPGPVMAGAGAIDEMINPIFGVDAVTNADPATPGRARESDGEFRLRWADSLQRGASSSTAAIRAAVLAVDGVQACVVLRNDDAVPVTIEGVAMDPHSVAVVVHPSTLTDAQEEAVVRAIFAKVAAGTKMMGGQTRQVTTAAGTVEEVRWSWASVLPVAVTLQVEMEQPSPGQPEPPAFADVQGVIVDATVAYGATLGLGQDVRRLPVLAAVDAIAGVRSVTSLALALVPADPSRLDAAGNLRLFATEIASIDPGDVTVTEAT